MDVSCVHAGRVDRLGLLSGSRRSQNSTAFPEAPELLIFVRADEVAGDLAVAGHSDGLALARI